MQRGAEPQRPLALDRGTNAGLVDASDQRHVHQVVDVGVGGLQSALHPSRRLAAVLPELDAGLTGGADVRLGAEEDGVDDGSARLESSAAAGHGGVAQRCSGRVASEERGCTKAS